MTESQTQTQTSSNTTAIAHYRTENEYGHGTVRSWASLIDDNCREQAEAISRVPIVEGYLALMPDAHFGYGPPVGSALLTLNAVMPYAVGVDIGCGMYALKTSLRRADLMGAEREILGRIRLSIPSGMGKSHGTETPASTSFFNRYGPPPSIAKDANRLDYAANRNENHSQVRERLDRVAREQFGTLGSGNHFVEVCEEISVPGEGVGGDSPVWFVLHSGSRGIGNSLATMHVKIAQELASAAGIPLESKEFAYFTADQDGFDHYLDDMVWCQQYAFDQREAMMQAMVQGVREVLGRDFDLWTAVNCHHNYAEEIEEGLWLTRKGAIDASVGRQGVIPGSMGAATYIVTGLGNEESYNTSPHGAGRLLGRGAAKRELSMDEFKAQMEGKTWLDRDAQELLDEAPFAYKPIETVIKDAESLVVPTVVLSQFINYKGVGDNHNHNHGRRQH